MNILSALFISFCALFIALDAIGLLPKFSIFIKEMPPKEIRKKLISSVYMALAIVIGLLIVCKIITWMMGISTADFQIGAGIVLFIMSVYYLLNFDVKKEFNLQATNVLPLAVPIIIGTNVIVMVLVLMSSYGLIITSFSFAANMFLVYIIFRNSDKLQSVLGENGIAFLSKTVSILLSVFSIMLIKKGLIALLIEIWANNS